MVASIFDQVDRRYENLIFWLQIDLLSAICYLEMMVFNAEEKQIFDQIFYPGAIARTGFRYDSELSSRFLLVSCSIFTIVDSPIIMHSGCFELL